MSKNKNESNEILEDDLPKNNKKRELNAFDYYIIIPLIILSTLLVSLETFYIGSIDNIFIKYQHFFKVVEIVIIFIFVVEIIVRLKEWEWNFKKYLLDPWNSLDFVIVSISLISLIPYFLGNSSDSTHSFILISRSLRVFILVSEFPKLEVLIQTTLNSLKSMSFVVVMLFILFLFYANTGVNLFGKINSKRYGTLYKTTSTNINALTGNFSINDIVNEIEASRGKCDSIIKKIRKDKYAMIKHYNECENAHFLSYFDDYYKLTVPLYNISFFFIGGLIVLNLIIGIIISEHTDAKIEHSKTAQDITTSDINEHIDALEKQVKVLSELNKKRNKI